MTLYDFHLHWYPDHQVNRLRSRLDHLCRQFSSVVGVVYDMELCRCWEEFQKAWRFLPLADRSESGDCLSGTWEETETRLVFYRGTQLISEENIELLVIGPEPDTGSLAAMVDEALRAGSTVLLPWGFGKWRGGRGRLIEQEFAQERPGLFASDSGTRPHHGCGARMISGIYTQLPPGTRLNGSDPLPMPDEEERFFTTGMTGPAIDTALPETSGEFAGLLRDNIPSLKPFHEPLSSRAAIQRQIRLRRSGFSLSPPKAPSIPGRSDAGDIESSTDRYARRFSGAVGAFFLAKQAKLTLELAHDPDRPSGEILDIGGGHAQLAPHFLAEGWSVSIFSSSDSCRKRPDRLMGSENYRFATGDLLHLPYPDNSFDVVTLFRLVTHEGDWQALIAEAARVSRRRVILDYPDSRSFNALSRLLFLVKKAVEKDTREFALFNRKKIAAATKEAGLEDLRWRPQFFLPMAFYRLVGSGRLAALLESLFQGLRLTSLLGSPVIVSGTKVSSNETR